MSADGSILFSYPQCRIVNKNTAGSSGDDTMSVYPDFGIIQLVPGQLPNKGSKVERVKLLVEVKRFPKNGNGEKFSVEWRLFSNRCSPKDQLQTKDTNHPPTLHVLGSLSIRQLLLQAYSAFNVYAQHELFIMFISGTDFTLFKFHRPQHLGLVPQEPKSLNKKQKLRVKGTADGEAESQSAKEINDTALTTLIPLEYIEVVDHGVPVFESTKPGRGPGLFLSNTFHLSRTRKPIDQITQVCQEICDMKLYSSKRNPDQLNTCHKNKEPPPDKCEKGEKDCTC